MNPRARIDPLAGDRCQHDMLRGQCSWCLGLRDVPILDLLGAELADDRSIALRWVPSEVATECAQCHQPIRRGEKVAWVREVDGNIGLCCEDAA